MPVQDVTETARRLLHVPLFEGLSQDMLAQIVSLSYPKEANAGEFFFNEGDQADEFLVLMAGRVKLTQLTADGQQVVLRLIGPGDAFGGVGAFGEPTYPISAEAVEDGVSPRVELGDDASTARNAEPDRAERAPLCRRPTA